DGDVLAFNKPAIAQAIQERLACRLCWDGRVIRQEPNTIDFSGRLLRARRERPGGCRAADECDERAPVAHSMTSSAMESTPGGTSMPSACAVCRFRANSNLVDCSTGNSPGFPPLRIRPA